MIGLLVLLVLAWQFYIGYSRGLILQGYYFFTSLLSLLIASQFYQKLASAIYLWIPYSNASEGSTVSFFTSVSLLDLDKVYYAGVAFFAIYAVAYYVFRFLGIFVHLFKLEKADKRVFNLVSGCLAVLVSMMAFSMIFSILATIPMTFVQNLLSGSLVARFLINAFVPFTTLLNYLWVTAVV